MSSKRRIRNQRNGNIVVMAAFLLGALLSIVAVSVNLGIFANSLAQLQNASDAGSKAGAWTLMDSYAEPNANQLATTQAKSVTQAAIGIADTLSDTNDVKFGQYVWNPITLSFDTTWGVTPANLVQTKLSRLDARSNSLDVVLRKFMGRDTVELKSRSNVVFMPATGFQPPSGNQTLEILPFALDIDTWIAMEEGSGNDEFKVDPTNNSVTLGCDGMREIKIFPLGSNKSLPSGNRGTLRLGANNNSTSKLGRQIREGLNSSDMSYHPKGFSVADGPINIPGDPGVSAAIEHDLDQILGENRILPLFDSVNGNGANASYSIVKFVGVRVVKVDLRGALNHKAVLIQPSSFAVEEATTNMKMPINQTGNVFVKPFFINVQ